MTRKRKDEHARVSVRVRRYIILSHMCVMDLIFGRRIYLIFFIRIFEMNEWLSFLIMKWEDRIIFLRMRVIDATE